MVTELLQTFSLKVHCFAILASEGANFLAAEWAGVAHVDKLSCESEGKVVTKNFSVKKKAPYWVHLGQSFGEVQLLR